VAVAVGVAVAVALGVSVMVSVGVGVGTQPPASHASQQLAKPLAQMAPPPTGALHFAALDFTTHFVVPFALVRQHVTDPAVRPHVERVTHFFTAAPQDDETWPCVIA
jgi:hypothetical protein